jgi:ABC-2 type transport system permease protein
MSRKTRVVIRREFLFTVKRPSWLVVTFGMPVFLGLYALIAMIPGLLVARGQAKLPRDVAIVDHSGVLPPALESPDDRLAPDAEEVMKLGEKAGGAAGAIVRELAKPVRFRRFEAEESAFEALKEKEVSGLYVVDRDFVSTGSVRFYSASENPLDEKPRGTAALRRLMARGLVGDSIDPSVLVRVMDGPRIDRWSLQKDGTWARRGLDTILRGFAIPLGSMMLLFVAILANAGNLLQGLSEEKESRVVEVLMSSVDARTLMIGKLVGLGAAGLVQLGVWLIMAIVPVLALLAGFALDPVLVLLCVLFFVLGFLLYGTLMMATGSLGTNAQESQQYGMYWVIVSVVGLLFFPVLLAEPNGVAARVLSWIPLTAPTTMMLRLGAGGVPWWDILVAVAVLATSVALSVRLTARIFRAAILMYGKRPTIPEIWRWVRDAS